MSNVQLYIGNTPVDMPRNSVVAVTRSVHDLTNLETRNGDYSNTFTLPLTAKNKALLGWPNDINSESTIPYTKIEAVLMSGADSLPGYVEVGEPSNAGIPVTFYSGNTEFFDALGNRKLTDLDLSAYDVYWTIDNAFSPNIMAYKSNTTGSIFPIVEYGQNETFRALPTDSRTVNPKGLRPAIYTKTIVEEICKDIDFVVDGDFQTDPRYVAEAIPIVKSQPKHTDGWNADNLFTARKTTNQTIPTGTTAKITFPTEVSDPSNNFNSPNYIVPATGKYSASLTYLVLGVDLIGGTYPVLRIVSQSIDGTRVVLRQTVITTIMLFPSQLTCIDVDLNQGDALFVEVEAAAIDATFRSDTFDGVFSVTEIKDSIIGYGNLFEMTGNLPELTCKQFIRALCHRYNLIISTRQSVVKFYPYLDVYNNEGIDWTDKIDVSSNKVSLRPDFYGQINTFKYLQDSHVPDDYADGELLVDDQTLDREVVNVEQPFAASLDVKRLINLNVVKIELLEYDADVVGAGSPPTLGQSNEVIFIDETIKNTFFGKTYSNFKGRKFKLETVKPRVLYINLQSITSIPITYNDGSISTFNSIAPEPLTWFWDADMDFNLTFKNGEKGLIDNYIELGFALEKYKKLTALFNLKASDVYGFDFERAVYIAPYGKFYVNKIINYQPGKLTQVELIKM